MDHGESDGIFQSLTFSPTLLLLFLHSSNWRTPLVRFRQPDGRKRSGMICGASERGMRLAAETCHSLSRGRGCGA